MRKSSFIGLCLLALSMLGSKCKGPKPPKVEAAEVVEDAYWAENVELALDEHEAVEVELEVVYSAGETVSEVTTVIFQRHGDQVRATIELAGQSYPFAVSRSGEATLIASE